MRQTTPPCTRRKQQWRGVIVGSRVFCAHRDCSVSVPAWRGCGSDAAVALAAEQDRVVGPERVRDLMLRRSGGVGHPVDGGPLRSRPAGAADEPPESVERYAWTWGSWPMPWRSPVRRSARAREAEGYRVSVMAKIYVCVASVLQYRHVHDRRYSRTLPQLSRPARPSGIH